MPEYTIAGGGVREDRACPSFLPPTWRWADPVGWCGLSTSLRGGGGGVDRLTGHQDLHPLPKIQRINDSR